MGMTFGLTIISLKTKKIWQTPSKICLMFDNTPRIARALATRLGVELLPAHSHDGLDRVFGMLVNGRLCGCWKDVLKTLNEIERRQNDPS